MTDSWGVGTYAETEHCSGDLTYCGGFWGGRDGLSDGGLANGGGGGGLVDGGGNSREEKSCYSLYTRG